MGGLTSGAGGEDSLQVGIAVFCVVVSLVITAMVPAIVPEYDADGDLLNDSRIKMENFTGESMLSSSPWKLTSVRTPYTANAQENVVSDYGWIYGSISTTYEYQGVSYINEEVVRLDPSQRSNAALIISEDEVKGTGDVEKWYFADNLIGDLIYGAADFVSGIFGNDVDRYEKGTVSGQAFNFSGLLYHFDPTYRISTQGSSTTKLNSDMASLNIVWYDSGSESGISGGLVLQSDKSKAIIANYSSIDIIASIETDSDYATKYLLNFDGVQVFMYIYFDKEVMTAQTSLIDAWNQGLWSIAFASPSADGLMDIFNSNSLSSSMGNLIDTYLSVFTFNMPNCPTEWSLVLWIVCVLPMEIAVMMFLSRFGVLGLGAGILGNALAFIGGL